MVLGATELCTLTERNISFEPVVFPTAEQHETVSCKSVNLIIQFFFFLFHVEK